MNDQNIKPHEFTSDQNREEAAKNGRKGGKASGARRKQRKMLAELINYFGTANASEKEAAVMAKLGIKPEMMTRDMQIVVSLYNKAMKGDVAAFNAIRDIKGEKPTESLNVNLPSTVKIEIVDSDYDADFASSEEEVDASR